MARKIIDLLIGSTIGAGVFLLFYGYCLNDVIIPDSWQWIVSVDGVQALFGWFFYLDSLQPWHVLAVGPGYLPQFPGLTVAFTDSIPVLAAAVKFVKATAFPEAAGPLQLFGIWLLMQQVLQGTFSWLIGRRLGLDTGGRIVLSFLCCSAPMLLDRMFIQQFALSAHWLLLAAAYCALAYAEHPAYSRLGLAAINALAAGIHPYMLSMTMAITLIALAPRDFRLNVPVLIATITMVAGLAKFFGYLDRADATGGTANPTGYSANVLSAFNIGNAFPYQIEAPLLNTGYNGMGWGGALLLAAAACLTARKKFSANPILVAACLFAALPWRLGVESAVVWLMQILTAYPLLAIASALMLVWTIWIRRPWKRQHVLAVTVVILSYFLGPWPSLVVLLGAIATDQGHLSAGSGWLGLLALAVLWWCYSLGIFWKTGDLWLTDVSWLKPVFHPFVAVFRAVDRYNWLIHYLALILAMRAILLSQLKKTARAVLLSAAVLVQAYDLHQVPAAVAARSPLLDDELQDALAAGAAPGTREIIMIPASIPPTHYAGGPTYGPSYNYYNFAWFSLQHGMSINSGGLARPNASLRSYNDALVQSLASTREATADPGPLYVVRPDLLPSLPTAIKCWQARSYIFCQ